MRLVETSGSLFLTQEVVRPNGTTVCFATGATDQTCPLDTTGTGMIIVEDSAGTNTGAYAIAVRTLNTSTGCTALTFGAAATPGTISAAAQMHCYSFAGTTGDKMTAHDAKSSGLLSPQQEIVRPNRTTICGPSTSTDLLCTLDTTGTYIIIVEDSTGTNTGGYTIKVTKP